MIPYERRLQIAELLEKNEVVSLDEFCKSLGVSLNRRSEEI